MASDDAFVFKTIKEHVITGETATRVAALRVINLIINKCDDVEETFRDADMKGMQSKIVLRTVSVGSIKVCNQDRTAYSQGRQYNKPSAPMLPLPRE